MCKNTKTASLLIIAVAITSFILIGLAITVVILGQNASEISIEYDAVLSQVADDWSAIPWTGISVQDQPCDAIVTEPFFQREWPGTKAGCRVSDEAGGEKIVTVEEAAKEGKACDDPVKATRGIIQTEFFGKHICG